MLPYFPSYYQSVKFYRSAKISYRGKSQNDAFCVAGLEGVERKRREKEWEGERWGGSGWL